MRWLRRRATMNMEIQSKITLNGGQALARILKSCGIENVYGVVGGA
jgi:hypothetical protein